MTDSAPPGGPVGEPLRLTPSEMVAGGLALARDDSGRVVFVSGALPGEEVNAVLTESRVDFGRAIAVEVLQPSPDRVEPPCPAAAAGCGGCTWQHIAPAAQARYKAGIVLDTLRRVGRFAGPPSPAEVPLPGAALRTTARLAVSPAGRAGYRPRQGPSYQAIETDSCLAAHPMLAELIVAGRYPASREVVLRVAVSSGERIVKPRPAGAASGVQVPPGVVVAAEDAVHVHESVGGRTFQVGIDSFFQSGPVAAEALVDAVAAALDGALDTGDHLVDLYAGVGLLAGVIGPRSGARVTAVESDRSALADARVNLADLDAHVVGCDVGSWRPRRRDRPIAAVIADPPRPGLGRPGVATVLATRARRVVLVGCDPASFARDAGLLRDGGYNLESLALVDAFPHTFHVEVVGRFDLSGA